MPPNILFICTDQQRYDTLGCYGNAHIQTPTIDRLAQEGVLFEQCYVQSPVCGPSRASLLTGRYVHNHGLWANGVALPQHEELFTKVLADGGYDCGMVGKMHLAACYQGRTEARHDDGLRYYRWAHDPSHGSPENAYHRWLEQKYPAIYAEAIARGPGRKGHDPVRFDTVPTEAHYSHWVGEQAIEFLQTERDPQKPFFLWLNFYDPHHPFVAPQEYLDRYDPTTLPVPISVPNELESKPAILTEASQKSYNGFAKGFAEYTPDEVQEAIRGYYAMISLIDDEVKRILETLKAGGLDEETLIVFTSDHGEMLGDHQLMLKGPMMFEGAVHVPLILRWANRFAADTRRSELVEWIDLGATLLDAAGLPPQPRGQGRSLLPPARGETIPDWRDWALCEYRNSGHPYDPPVYTTMLRHDRYKLIVHHGHPATPRTRDGELYDLAADPQELTNLWHLPEYAAIRMQLYEILVDVMVATEDRSQPREAYW